MTRRTTNYVPWSPSDIPDQVGRTAVVTGGNSGIGYVTARELATAGARVVLACRDLDRARAAQARIQQQHPGGEVLVRQLDLAELRSVRAFGESWDLGPLDLLVNNAGVALVPYRRTADGFESQLGINYLGHFALTGLLLPHLLAAPAARVVSVSSESQRWGRIDVTKLGARRGYHRLTAYVRSKQAIVYFAVELQRLMTTADAPLRSMAVTPGYTATNLLTSQEHHRAGVLWRAMVTLGNRLAKTVDEGAATTLYAATVPEVPGGSYVAPSGILELRGHPTPRHGRRATTDEVTARKLWAFAEELTGVRYPHGRGPAIA